MTKCPKCNKEVGSTTGTLSWDRCPWCGADLSHLRPRSQTPAFQAQSPTAASSRRELWSRIGVLTIIFFAILAFLGIELAPVVLQLQGPNGTSDGLFVASLGGIVVGLVALGMNPRRRVSSVYLDRSGMRKAPSVTGGVIGLSLVFSGFLLLVVAGLTSSLLH